MTVWSDASWNLLWFRIPFGFTRHGEALVEREGDERAGWLSGDGGQLLNWARNEQAWDCESTRPVSVRRCILYSHHPEQRFGAFKDHDRDRWQKSRLIHVDVCKNIRTPDTRYQPQAKRLRGSDPFPFWDFHLNESMISSILTQSAYMRKWHLLRMESTQQSICGLFQTTTSSQITYSIIESRLMSVWLHQRSGCAKKWVRRLTAKRPVCH